MIKQLLSLLPPFAIYHIIRESIEFERNSHKPIEHVAVGWQPDETYTERINEHGDVEYFKVIRKGKS